MIASRGTPVIVPTAIHLEPLDRVAPAAFVSLGDAGEGLIEVRDLEARVEHQLDRILAFVAERGERASEGWGRPAR